MAAEQFLSRETILPCPFCGCRKAALETKRWIFVECDNCGAQGPKEVELRAESFPRQKQTAINGWNSRSYSSEHLSERLLNAAAEISDLAEAARELATQVTVTKEPKTNA